MDNKKMEAANRKAMPRFVLALVICSFIGGVIGYCFAVFGLDEFSGNIQSIGEAFGVRVAPWLLLLLAILLPFVSTSFLLKANKLLASWNEENETLADTIDATLTTAIWISNTVLIFSFFLIAATYSGGRSTFDNQKNIALFFISILAFFAILIETFIIQQKCVDTVKKTNPEKMTVSVYDMKFQKKWVDSCDEAEKILIGKCAFKSFSATNTACVCLSGALALCALVFQTGFLPSLAVCLVWIVNQSAYYKEAIKYSKAGNKIL